jgi:hypothetical protein
VANQLERFREGMARILPGASTAATPAVVVVFNSQQSFGRFRPRFEGRPTKVGGYFVSRADLNLVALTVEHREFALRTIFHEYAHLVVANAVRSLPAWLNEGLAEYYSTFAIRGNGESAILGAPIPEHLQLLNTTGLLKLDELLKVDRDSPLYNEGSRRGLFYAQSWAVVHTLLNGTTDRSQDLTRYARATASGASAADAWREVFPDLDANGAVKRHVAQRIVRAYQFRFTGPLTEVRTDATRASVGEAEAALGDLLRHVAPGEEAEAQLETAMSSGASASRATALMGQLRVEQGRYDAARPLLIGAARSDDWLTAYTAATGLTRLMQLDQTADNKPAIGAATAAVDVVLAARPELPYAHAMRALLLAETDGGLDASRQAIRRAREHAPGREDFAFTEASILARGHRFAEARAALGPFMSSRNAPAVRERARLMMIELLRFEQAVAAVPAGSPPPDRPEHTSVFVPEYRKPAPGEQKVDGTLERIECAADRVMLHVRVGDAVARYVARNTETIEFVTFRHDLTGRVACGERVPPDPVLVTWRAADPVEPDAAGVVVAVEFLPLKSP